MGLKDHGAVSPALLLGTIALCLGMFGTWGLLRTWRHRVETQLRIDRCVGTRAQSFRSALSRIEELNTAINAAREAATAGAMVPGVVQTALATTTALATAQELVLRFWNARRLQWLALRGCDGNLRDLPGVLPALAYLRPPPDALGPPPLRWIGRRPSRFRIGVRSGTRHSGALIEEEELNEWSLRWTSID